MNIEALAEIAREAATAAGQMIAQSRPQQITRKEGGESLASQVLTEIDRASQDLILSILNPTFSEIGLLTEESEDDCSRFERDYFWCIDPLDGTLPFIEGIAGYSVSIALVGRDGTPHIGVIYDPVEQRLYDAVRGTAYPVKTTGNDYLSLITDRSFENHPHYAATRGALDEIATSMGLSGGVRATMTGGAAMNAIGVLENAPACYFKFSKKGPGGGSLWDFAATACLFEAAGAVATDFAGNPLDLNRADSTFMNHRGILYATDEALAAKIRALAVA